MTTTPHIRRLISGLVVMVLLTGIGVHAAPPHPDLVESLKNNPDQPIPYYLEHLDEVRRSGINSGQSPYEPFSFGKAGFLPGATLTGNFNLLVLLVDFNDHPAVTTPLFFDSLVFGTSGYTVFDYYETVSNGQLSITTVTLPSAVGWRTAPEDYSYYTNGQSGIDIFAYPNNALRLVEDLVTAVDNQVDFSDFDNDNNGFVDALVVVHSGRGAERTGSDDDIWSHQSSIVPKLTNDGVRVSNYMMMPEYIDVPLDQTIGVYVHELGHGLFNLPDLYDIDYNSAGVGLWCVMSSGSWLGPQMKGERPCLPSAWIRTQLGYDSVHNVTTTMNDQNIGPATDHATIYRLWNGGAAGDEYFLVENRQKTGYDSYLRGEGLLIWHVDDSRSTNNNPWQPGDDPTSHNLVALEQADGDWDLENYNNSGDDSDPFPGTSGSTSFEPTSTPSSASYLSGNTTVAVTEIATGTGDLMIADLSVSLATDSDDVDEDLATGELPTTIALQQNYPNPFNPTTTIAFETSVSGRAVLEIYNITGQKVTTLLDADVPAGPNQVEWDATAGDGQKVASGIYFYRLQLEDQTKTRKLTFIK